MNICIVEDAAQYVQLLKRKLSENVSDASFIVISTELAFYNALPQLEKNPPLLFILDLMMRWSDKEDSHPEDIIAIPDDGYLYAGTRIHARIRNSEHLKNVPVILLSARDPNDIGLKILPAATIYHEKPFSHRFIEAVRSFIAAQQNIPQDKMERMREMLNSTNLTPEFMGVSIDLKKLWNAIRHSGYYGEG